jgi:TRAP-type C4-dicarboxylate transport system permease small subunit
MEAMLDAFLKVSKGVLNAIGGAALTFIMFLTVADVGLRAAGHPIIGTFEIVALSLALIIGFCFPCVSLDKGNVFMEFLLERLSPTNRALMNTFTRILGIILFALIAYNLFGVGSEFHRSREVTATLRIPFYPVAYGVGVCCIIECLVFVMQVVKIWKGRYE